MSNLHRLVVHLMGLISLLRISSKAQRKRWGRGLLKFFFQYLAWNILKIPTHYFYTPLNLHRWRAQQQPGDFIDDGRLPTRATGKYHRSVCNVVDLVVCLLWPGPETETYNMQKSYTGTETKTKSQWKWVNSNLIGTKTGDIKPNSPGLSTGIGIE